MKTLILKKVDEYVNLLNTMFKLQQADFVKNNIPTIINNVWDESKSDQDNLKELKGMLILNANINKHIRNKQTSELIKIFLEQYLNDIN